MMNRVITAASRLENFDKPTVWSLMTPLAIRTNSINLVSIILLLGTRISCMVTPKILSTIPKRILRM